MMKACLKGIGFLLFMVLCQTSFALTPPRPGEIEQYQYDGSFTERVNRAKQIGNDKADPNLILNMQRRLYELQGISVPDRFPAPPPNWRGGLPAFGTPKVLVILVDFPDYPHSSNQTVADVQSKLFGAGAAADAPYESLRTFYQRSSYNQLNVTGTVLGWYRATKNRSYYKNLGDGTGQDTLIKEAINYYNNQGHDFAQYDNNNDGRIDAFFIKWTGPDEGWSSFWWAYQWNVFDQNYMVDGKRLGKYVWSWYDNPSYGMVGYHAKVDIHETGHLLGVPDYYDYKPGVGPEGGVGRLDMMDGNWGDHNSFSKFMLEWITPVVIGSGSQTKTLNPSGTSHDAILIMPNAKTSPFAEFFMAQYRKRNAGNDPSNYPTDGLIVWHVDARLNAAGTDFQYNNSDTAHKLLRLMEADGLEEIEQKKSANAGDFYRPPKSFGPQTSPSSKNYQGQNTGVLIDALTTPVTTMAARFSVGSSVNYTLNVAKIGTGVGTITSSPTGISCGSTCSKAFPAGTIVKLTATPAAGSVFAGWSGHCTGTVPTCTVTMSAARNVTATFNRSTATYLLSIAKAGTGAGTVTSSPAGISCGTVCSKTFPVNTVVTLTATPAAGSVFAGWSGHCSGTATTCKVTMGGARNVTATFNKVGSARWSALTNVCCTGGPLTYEVTIGGVTKRSTASSCSANPTFEGFASTTAGAKSVTAKAISSACGLNAQGQGTVTMVSNACYRFTLNLQNGSLVNTFGTVTCPSAANADVSRQESPMPIDTLLLGGADSSTAGHSGLLRSIQP